MSNNGQHIQRKMKDVRREIEQDADQLVDSARQLGNWKEYVRAYPWLSVGGAAALGFLIAPSRSRAVTVQADDDDTTVATAAAGGTMLGMVGATLGKAVVTMAAKAAIDYMTSKAGGVGDTSDMSMQTNVPQEEASP